MRAPLLFLLMLLAGLIARANDAVTVGIEGRLDVLLPVAALKAKLPERQAPLTVRIAFSTPEGTSTRYSLRYIGLVPGRHDIRPFLTKEDGSPAEGLPPIEVEIRGILPEGQQGTILPIPTSSIPRLGGYFGILGAIGILWVAVALVVFRRPAVKPAPAPLATNAAPSLPERLRPLVEKAASGNLDAAAKAELERMVIGHWRERLNLGSLPPFEALGKLKAHPQAGLLLRAMEDWLHRPPGSVAVDLEPLLAAYAPETGGRTK